MATIEATRTPLHEPATMPLLLAAKLFCAQGKRLVTLLTLEGRDAVLTMADDAAADGIVVLARNGVRASGEVAWRDGHRIGLTLDAALEGGQAALFLGDGVTVAPRRGARHPLPAALVACEEWR